MARCGLPDLGVGVGLRVPHYADVLRGEHSLDVLEIISENFMVDGGPPRRNLERVLERHRVVLHGVSLSIASHDRLDFAYLRRLKALCRFTGTPWFSDHLCWSSTGGAHLHDLLPIPYTAANARYVAQRARIVQDFVELPFALENLSSYVTFQSSSMPEWEFYREVVERADCHMMLDVNNVFVSAVNHRFEPKQYLDALPLERVIQMHVAGHSDQPDGTLLDTHDHAVKPDVWALYRHVHRQTGGVTTILERDARIPPFAEVEREALLARSHREAAHAG